MIAHVNGHYLRDLRSQKYEEYLRNIFEKINCGPFVSTKKLYMNSFF